VILPTISAVLLPYRHDRYVGKSSIQQSDLLQVGCLVLFIAGCALAFGSEERVLRQLDALNGLFLAGSLLLLFDTAWDVWWCFYCFVMRTGNNELCDDCHQDSSSSSPETGTPEHPHPVTRIGTHTPLTLTNNTTRCASWMVSIAFTFAAVLGGYGRTITVVRAGMFGWAIGSVVGGFPPLLSLVQIHNTRPSRNRPQSPAPLVVAMTMMVTV
jgi:hypothetical protein